MLLDRRTFFVLLAVITVVRLVFISWIPIKNDEAYYVIWAQHLAGGYYDHPPFIGWMIWFLSQFSKSIVWYRMTALGAGLVATWGVYYFSRMYWGGDKARFAALLFALSPSSLWLVFVSNDVPLLIFLVLSVVSFHKAVTESKYAFSLLSGVLLGLAFLTKYFAVITGIGFLVFSLLENRQQRLRHLAIVVAGVVPFAVQHILYNYHNCWSTVNFHLFVRNSGSNPGLGNFAGYLFELLLVLTPWGLWFLYRNRDRLLPAKQNLPLVLSLSAAAIFALISLESIIGLHFLLIFSPFVFALYGTLADTKQARGILISSFVYGAILLVLLLAILLYPLKNLQGWDQHSNFVVGLAPEKVCSNLDKYAGLPLFTNYYAYSGILSYSCKRDIQVLFGESKYGRQMDALLDVRKLDGKQLAIVDLGHGEPERYAPYFDSYRVERFEVEKAPFTVFIGTGFKYKPYRDRILKGIRERFYSPPGWLPSGGCPVTERYFGRQSEQ